MLTNYLITASNNYIISFYFLTESTYISDTAYVKLLYSEFSIR